MNNPGTFSYGDYTIPYLRSDITNAGNNQLSIEVPIALHFYNKAKYRNHSILEMGSVLPNYIPGWMATWEKAKDMKPFDRIKHKLNFEAPHICVDPTDTRIGIVHCDLDAYSTTKRFDLIISLSSMVCMFDSTPDVLTEKAKMEYFKEVIRRLKSFTKPTGTILVSLPWSYPNPYVDAGWLDKILNSLRHPEGAKKQDWEPTSYFKMNRIGFGIAGNQWIEKSDGYANLPYYKDIPSAGTMFFLIWNL